jgi:hypothetical protein
MHTLAQRAFDALNTSDFVLLSPKGRLEAFAWEYCRTVSEAPDEAVAGEAETLGLPVDRLNDLRALVAADRTKILAEVLRIFGDRKQSSDEAAKIDRLMDEVLGTSGHEGTLPG